MSAGGGTMESNGAVLAEELITRYASHAYERAAHYANVAERVGDPVGIAAYTEAQRILRERGYDRYASEDWPRICTPRFVQPKA